MYAIYDNVKSVAIWWSAKCGCSTIKNLYYNYIKAANISNVHIRDSYNCNPELVHYKNVLTVRNPYDRIVSAFLEKYVRPVSHVFLNDFLAKRPMPMKEFNFAVFIDYLYDYYINHTLQPLSTHELHHTTPQFSEAYDLVPNLKFQVIHQLETFDCLKFVESIEYPQPTIQSRLEIFTFITNVIPYTKIISLENAHMLNFSSLNNDYLSKHTKINYASFLSPEITAKITQIYHKDLNILKNEYGIIYSP